MSNFWNTLERPKYQDGPQMAATSHLDARQYFNLDLVSTAMFRELMYETRLFLFLRLTGISWIQDGFKDGSHIVI